MNNFSPSNLYIGIIDLFAILLPGSLVSLVVYHFYRDSVNDLLDIGEAHTGFYTAFALLFSSYLFGHIISQLSAYLDEWVYDNFKETVYGKDKDYKIGNKVDDIRKHKFGNTLEPELVNRYKWSVYKLQKDYAEAASEVERYMADSKFFRSLFLVLVIGLFVMAFVENKPLTFIALFVLIVFIIINIFYDEKEAKKRRENVKKESNDDNNKSRQVLSFLTLIIPFALISILSSINGDYTSLGLSCSLLALFAMIRYFKKRRKSTETAYQYIIFLEELNTKTATKKQKNKKRK